MGGLVHKSGNYCTQFTQICKFSAASVNAGFHLHCNTSKRCSYNVYRNVGFPKRNSLKALESNVISSLEGQYFSKDTKVSFLLLR